MKKKVSIVKENSVENIQKDLELALDSMMTVLGLLKNTNKRINEKQVENSEKIKQLKNEQEILNKMLCKNSKVVSNFENLLDLKEDSDNE